MSEKYCPAGKCECRYFDGVSYRSSVCRHDPVMIFVDQYNQCPHESPKYESAFGKAVKNIVLSKKLRDEYAAGFLAGRIEQARVDREAVDAVIAGGMYGPGTLSFINDIHSMLAAFAPKEEA